MLREDFTAEDAEKRRGQRDKSFQATFASLRILCGETPLAFSPNLGWSIRLSKNLPSTVLLSSGVNDSPRPFARQREVGEHAKDCEANGDAVADFQRYRGSF